MAEHSLVAFDFPRAEEISNPLKVITDNSKVLRNRRETPPPPYFKTKFCKKKNFFVPSWTLESFQTSCNQVSDSGIY